jgi:hypothetical protein
MVLAELGSKIAGALRSLATKTVIDQGAFPRFLFMTMLLITHKNAQNHLMR